MSNTRVTWRPTVIWAGLPLFIGAVNEAGVAQALPAIGREFSVQVADLRWMALAFVVADAAILIAGARLGTVLGRRRVFMAGLMIFAISCIGSAASFNYPMLLTTRALAGVGAALFFSGILAIITQAVPKEVLGRAFGLWALVGAGAFMISPLVGGVFTELGSWRWIFVMNALVAIAALALTPRFFQPDSAKERGRLGDARGFVSIAVTIIALTVGLAEAPTRGWTSPVVLLCIVVGLVALVAAFAFERRAVSPLVPAALFRTRGYLTGTAVITISYASAGAMVFAIPIVLSMADGLSPISIGAIMLSYGVWWLVLPPFTGRLADRVSPVVMLTVGFASGLAGCLLATLVPSLQGIFGACCALALLGIGMALVVPTANRMTMLNIGAPLRGEASGVNMTSRLLGNLVGIAIVGTLIASNLGQRLPSIGEVTDVGSLTTGLQAIWIPVGVIMTLGIVVSALGSKGFSSQPAAIAEAEIGAFEDRG